MLGISRGGCGFAASTGVLVLDRNGDGRVTDFSERTFRTGLRGAGSDLEGLIAFDYGPRWLYRTRSMKLFFILLSLVGFDIEKVHLAALSSHITKYVGRNLEVCGTVMKVADPARNSPSNTYVMSRLNEHVAWAIYVESTHPDATKDRAEVCLKGLFRRVDGLSPEEARRLGRDGAGAGNGLNGQYMLYALRSKS